jgi:hypothetical protein
MLMANTHACMQTLTNANTRRCKHSP